MSDGVDYLGIKSNVYNNAGVTLLNLQKLKEEKKIFELINMANSNIFNFEDKSDIKIYINSLRTKIPFDELVEALKFPVIIHNVICYPKPWSIESVYIKAVSNCAKRNSCSCKKYFDIWHSFANKTDYYKEISKFTLIEKYNNK